MSPWNMFFKPKSELVLLPQQRKRVYGPFFFKETTITGIVYLDMLQQFLIPQLDVDDQGGHIHFQQDGTQTQAHSHAHDLSLSHSGDKLLELFLDVGLTLLKWFPRILRWMSYL
jgi:hypothetical protein